MILKIAPAALTLDYLVVKKDNQNRSGIIKKIINNNYNNYNN